MDNDFANEKEAREALALRVIQATTRFCPIARAAFRSDCVAFYPGHVYSPAGPIGIPKSYRVFPPSCTAPSLVPVEE